MYVHEGKRIFFVTIREVRDDGTLGESESFSIHDSETRMNRTDLVKLLIETIDKTDKK